MATKPNEIQLEVCSAKEIAEVIGRTERAVQLRAKREGWKSQPREGRGGGVVYIIQFLPKDIRDLFLDRAIAALPEPVCTLPVPQPEKSLALAAKALPPAESLAGWQRRTMDARLALLREVDRLAASFGVNRAVARVCELAAGGQLPEHLQILVPVANAKSGGKDGGRTLSERSLKRWKSEAKKGHTALAPAAPGEKNPAKARPAVPEWGTALLKVWRKPQKPSLAEAIRELNASGIEVTYGKAQRFLEKLGEIEKNKGRMGAKEIKTIMPFRRRDTSNLWPADVYSADGHQFDAEVAHPAHGKPFRPEVTMIIDVATRIVAGWSVGLAESAIAVLEALSHACQKFSVPAIFYVDNGGGYKNDMMKAEGTGFMARLGIEMKHSIPWNSQARGLIERAHRTILVRAAQKLPTYMGALMDPDARKLAFKRTRKGEVSWLLEWADFVTLVEREIYEYHHREHQGLPRRRDPVTGNLKHYTPAEMFAMAIKEGWKPEPAVGQDDLYHPQTRRKTRNGEIQLFNNLYFSKDLGQWHDSEVLVSFDIHDPKKVWVRDGDQRLICTAEIDANKSDYFPLSVVEQAREKRADGRRKRLERDLEKVEMERIGVERKQPIDITPAQQESYLQIEEDLARKRAEEEREKAEEESRIAAVAADMEKEPRPMWATPTERYEWLLDRRGEGKKLTADEAKFVEEFEVYINTGKKSW